ncbi:MAG: RnfABCDGE type electron transport complex subunit D [Elusimicrobiota bacterium]|nr:RnfABCDGE type electron transport complex subunit D [Endomicrobiia bacterium]MDW8164960.1 RnfABCDGE type electron transport complex subunit D [Elusimicrobiota bacterium]
MQEEKIYLISPAPHIRATHSISTMMRDTIFALVPAGVGAVMFFGMYALIIIISSVIFCILFEILVNFLRKQKPTVFDLSCIITGILFAYTLPPKIPIWIVAVGCFVAIVFGKHFYGGLGHNPFNPALVGRAFIHIAFPQNMGDFSINGISSATPLTILKHFPQQVSDIPSIQTLIWGNYPGCIGETSVVLLLLGYLYLVIRKHINPFVPILYILTVGIFSAIIDIKNVLIYLFCGGIFLGGIFMITDPVTTPITPKGKIIFAIMCGLLTCTIRFWGSYPEGVCFSILFMNLLTPLIDEYTICKKFGHRKI